MAVQRLGVALVGLVLGMAEFAGPRRWRWLLTDEDTGQSLADHQVSLEEEPGDFEAFTGLYRYLRWNAVPDRRAASEAEIVARVGAWAGAQVLGEPIARAILDAAPVTVRVEVPAEAAFVLAWPLELAHAGGKPLAMRGDVTLVYDFGAPSRKGSSRRPSAGEMRMLAVFSLPTHTSVLALRRERYELARLIRRIAARQNRRVSLSLLQYGVTRERLAEAVDSGDGWDVLHLSGHGGRGQFLLEHADGSPDEVDTAELTDLLRPLRRRLQLAVVSACESAAAAMAETLRWVGLDEQAEQLEQEDRPAPPAGGEPGPAAEPVTGVARAFMEELGCAVVAMRYPVTDEFAIAFTADLYERVFGRNQALGTALARAVADEAGSRSSPARPAICLATPILVGAEADQLRLNAPTGQPPLDPALVRMERFPPEPERFVGRARAMARASAALAPGSGLAGVLLHGMAGSGKTACALELAYRHQDSFAAAAFWQAPETKDVFGEALASLAATLDIQLGAYGFAMSGNITPIQALEAFLPRLRRLLEDNGILLVLDNLETLLTGDGQWRDPRWGPLMTALTGHGGESRVILTSRIPPTEPGESMLVLPVHALSLDETAALARELPRLRGLLHTDASPLRASDQIVARDRGLVRRVLHVMQGHPKLMELADAAATDPDQLAAHLVAAENAAAGQVLDAFFRDGTTQLEAAQFLDTLTGWTSTALAALPKSAQLMALFLASLEDSDRVSFIVEATWARLWERLDQPSEPPRPRPLLAALTQAALIQASSLLQGEDGEEAAVAYRMHPGIAQAIRSSGGPSIQAAADAELAVFWAQLAFQALEQEGGEAGQAVVQSGLAAAPYLLRLKQWDTAGSLLRRAINRNPSPAIIQATLPALRAIANATRAPVDIINLAEALQGVDPSEANKLLRDALAQAVADGDFRIASAAARVLSDLLFAAGRLSEALDVINERIEYNQRAGLGPWTQLSTQQTRLKILVVAGKHQQVLEEVRTFLAQMDQLPASPGDDEDAIPWNVRETLLNIGYFSAQGLDEWQQCLDLNAAIIASMESRGASDYDVAYVGFNDYRSLIKLGRFRDAERLLTECQRVFEEHNDLDQLGNIFGARADLEAERGNPEDAVVLQQTAVRYHYLRREPQDIGSDHNNLAGYLWVTGSDPVAQRAHRLAAVLIAQFTGMADRFTTRGQALARELRRDTNQSLPGTLDEVIDAAEQTEGVHLRDLLISLQPDSQAAADALAQILRAAAEMNPYQDEIQRQLENWEPAITAIAAAANGNAEAAAELAPVLDSLAQQEDWAALVAVLRRILDGERGDGLLDGLDAVDTAIASQVLASLTQPLAAPGQEGHD